VVASSTLEVHHSVRDQGITLATVPNLMLVDVEESRCRPLHSRKGSPRRRTARDWDVQVDRGRAYESPFTAPGVRPFRLKEGSYRFFDKRVGTAFSADWRRPSTLAASIRGRPIARNAAPSMFLPDDWTDDEIKSFRRRHGQAPAFAAVAKLTGAARYSPFGSPSIPVGFRNRQFAERERSRIRGRR
jgi:hypothetical protein